MGFFDIFRKKEEAPAEPVHVEKEDIDLDEIVPKISDMLSSQMEESKRNVEKTNENIRKGLIRIKESAREMENAYFEKSDKTYTRINMVKDGWIKQLLGSLNSLPSIADITYKNIENYIRDVSSLMNNATATDPRQNYILTNYFKKEMKDIVASLGSISKDIEALGEEIAERSPLRIYGDLSDMAHKLKVEKKKLSDLEESTGKKEKEIKELESMKAEREKNLENAKKSPEMMRLTNIRKTIAKTEKEISETRLRLSEDLNSVNRPLKKIKHKMDSGESRSISEFLSSPVDVCLSDEGEKKVENIIRIVSRYADEEEVGLSEKDAKKIASFAGKIKGGEIGKTKNIIVEKTASLENMRDELKGLVKLEERQKAIESDIVMINSEKGRVKDELERDREEIKSLNGKIDSLKEEIADYTEKHLNTRLNIIP